METLKFLSDDDVKAMHEATLRVLHEVGVIWTHKPTLDILIQAGCKMNGTRVCFPPNLVMNSIAKANKRPVVRGRNGQVNELGGGNLHFHNLGGARDVFDARRCLSIPGRTRGGRWLRTCTSRFCWFLRRGHSNFLRPSFSLYEWPPVHRPDRRGQKRSPRTESAPFAETSSLRAERRQLHRTVGKGSHVCSRIPLACAFPSYCPVLPRSSFRSDEQPVARFFLSFSRNETPFVIQSGAGAPSRWWLKNSSMRRV